MSAQDLAGYQKLRGEIISSTVWPTTPINNVPVYFHGYNAFDTNRATAFRSYNRGGWVGLKLNDACPIKKVRIYPTTQNPERVMGVIQGASDPDFNEPVTLCEIATTPQVNRFTTYDITTDKPFRYVRLLANNSHECHLMELEFYTTADAQQVDYPQLSNLPTLYIETKGQFDFVDKEYYAKSTIVIADQTGVNAYPAEVKGRGNSTWEFMEKKSFRLKFDKKQQLLGMAANAKSWTLIANYTDKSMIRNGLAFEMSRLLGFEWTPSCSYADVVLDGCYYGTFAVCDHIQVNKDRIAIDEMKPTDITGDALTGGYHLELDAYAYQEEYYFYTRRNIPFTIKNPDEPCTTEQFNYIKNYIQQLEDKLYSDPAYACSQLIDLESAVKYYLHSELTGNCDAYWCIPCYKKRGDDRLYFGPVWDYDQAFLNNNRVPLNYATLDTEHGFAQPWFRLIMRQPQAKEILKREWIRLKEQQMEQQLCNYIDAGEGLLQESQTMNYQRWDCLNRHVWFDDYQYPTYNAYMTALKSFIHDRFAWYEAAMDDVLGNYHYFLTPSKPMNEKSSWRYLINESYAYNWYSETFNDTGWRIGKAPFGSLNNLQETLWNSNGTILIRKQFEVEQEAYDQISELYLTLFHDEDCWIYINGKEVMAIPHYNTYWENFVIDKSSIRPGTNQIAIKCVQTGGGQLIDAGIYAKLNEESSSIIPIEASTFSYTLEDSLLSIENLPHNSLVALYSADGRLIAHRRASGTKAQFYLPRRGIYLLRVGNRTVKIRR